MLIAFMLLAAITVFVVTFVVFNNYDYETQKLIELMGKQRTYTQIMAKCAFEIETLLKDPLIKSNAEKLNDLDATKKELEQAVNNFDTNLARLENGNFYVGNKKVHFKVTSSRLLDKIKQTNALWEQFKGAAETVIKKDTVHSDVSNKLAFIDEHNRELLDDSDSLVLMVIDYIKDRNQMRVAFFILLFAAVFVMVVALLYKVYRHLFVPLDELYEGMAQIGVRQLNISNDIKTSKYFSPLIAEIGEMFERLQGLISLITNINQSESFNETLAYIYSTYSKFIPYNYIGIALIKEGGLITASYGVADGKIKGLPDALLGKSVAINETSLGKVLESGNIRIINDLEEYVKGKPLKEYNRVILKSGIRSSITVPLKINRKPVGIIFFSSTKKNAYNDRHIFFLKTISDSIAISFDKNILINDILYGSILALAKLAESRDKDTGEHLQRIKVYSGLIVKLLSEDSNYKGYITPEYIENIEKFSPLHDIGKVAIPDNILLKPGKLTKEEFEIMRTHAIFGAWILKEADDNIKKSSRSIFQIGIEIAEGHHEKWDGTGYPFGKKGEDIPLSARIVAVSDVFDALTSKRPYKDAFSFEKAYEVILDGSGNHFAPGIVKVFIEHKDRFYEVYQHFFKGENGA